MIVDSILRVGINEIPKKEWERIERSLTFGKGNGDVVMAYRRLIAQGIYQLPRGAWAIMPDYIRYKDQRMAPAMPELNFTVKLDDISLDPRYKGQTDAVEAMFENEQGLIVRPPGTGKTQIALAFAAACKTRTLVLVHTEDILKQWFEYVSDAIPELEGKVGIIRGKTYEIGHITIATVQTLKRYIGKKKFWEQFGCVIADEAHHVSAPTWEAIMNCCPARYRFGFTASPTRADGMHPTMKFIIGPIIHRQKFSSPIKLTVVPVKTQFKSLYRGSWDYTGLVTRLVQDEERNKLIAEVVNREVGEGNSILVLSRRIEHLELIAEFLDHECEILTGKIAKSERVRIISGLRDGSIRCVLATQLADEALDVPRLNRVALVHPGKHEGRIIQQIGRAIRQHPTKQDAVIYDFIDYRISILRNQWNQRKRAYKTDKISIKSTGRMRRG
jgi:superfamily II DNA or RNA helicase